MLINGVKIKVSYGMTRFCKDFINGRKCKKGVNCTYFHSIPPTTELTSNHFRNINQKLRNLGEKKTI